MLSTLGGGACCLGARADLTALFLDVAAGGAGKSIPDDRDGKADDEGGGADPGAAPALSLLACDCAAAYGLPPPPLPGLDGPPPRDGKLPELMLGAPGAAPPRAAGGADDDGAGPEPAARARKLRPGFLAAAWDDVVLAPPPRPMRARCFALAAEADGPGPSEGNSYSTSEGRSIGGCLQDNRKNRVVFV